MRQALPALFASLCPFSTLLAQSEVSTDEAIALRIGEKVEATIEMAEEKDRYALSIDRKSFLFVRVDQLDVDVVVTLLDSSKMPSGKTDSTERGSEIIARRLSESGDYVLEISGFENATGRYTIEILRLESLAKDPIELTDQLMSPYADPSSPGAAVQVFRDGKTLYSKTYGSANLTWGIPFSVQTRTNIGSTSKQFTAFAVMLEAERGALSLDDDIRKHLPELPEFDHTITVRHLLTHTSGLREFLNLLSMTGRRLDHGDWIDRQEILDIVQRQPALQNVPGQEFNYNNTAFAFAALIVERTSGLDFHDYMQERVFEPLGMTRTMVRSTPEHIVPESSEGYTPTKQGFRMIGDLGGAVGAGAIYSSIEDLQTWVENYIDPEVGTRAMIDDMMTPFPVKGEIKSTGYGYGLFIDEQRGLRRVHHGGADTAHRSMLAYYPEIEAGITVQSNHASFDSSVAFELAAAFFADSMEAEKRAEEESDFEPGQFDAASFDAYAGRYSMDERPDFILTFSREGDTLYTQGTGQPRLEIVPISPTKFRLTNVEASVEFIRDDQGKVTGLTLFQNGEHPATRLEGEDRAAWKPDDSELEAFIGTYFSDELGTFYDIVLENEALMLQHRRLDDAELTPGERDQFSGGNLQFEFERDRNGKVIGFYLANGRTRDVRFGRVR